MTIGVRPEHLPAAEHATPASISGKLDVVERLGNLSLLYVTLSSGEQVIAESRDDGRIAVGQAIHFALTPSALYTFAADEQSVRRYPQDPQDGERVKVAA